MRFVRNAKKNGCAYCEDAVVRGNNHFYCIHSKCIYAGTSEMEKYNKINEQLEKMTGDEWDEFIGKSKQLDGQA